MQGAPVACLVAEPPPPAGPCARSDNVDDYVVLDPLLEAGKAKFNKQQQKARKRGSEWAGRAQG